MQEYLNAEPATDSENRSNGRCSQTILFVDDEPNVLRAFERELRTRFQVRTARGPFEGLSALEEGCQFAVVVSDLRMPGMDGFQLLEKVRSLSPDTARILLTGHADVPTVIQAVNDGNILRFLQKPCSLDALEEGLRIGLNHYQWLVRERRAAHAASRRRANQVMEMHREIDSSKQAVARVETALEQSDNRFHATFYGAPIGICLLASDGRIVESNHSLHQMLGLRREELLAVTLPACAYGDDGRQIEKCLEELVDAEQERCQVVTRYRRGDGQIGWARITMCMPPLANRNFVAIAMAEDITDQRRLEEQLLHAQKMEALGRLAGGIAHDFNNLLTVIRGNIDLAATLWPEVDDNLSQARQAAERAATLVDQLLMFSRKRPIEPQVLDLDIVVAEFEGMMRHLTGRQIELRVQVGAGGALLIADRTQVEQVLLNLAVNARDAMPDGGCLTIGVEIASSCELPGMTGECVILTVADTGIGMSCDVRALIFEPFFTTKGPGKGTGLGLSTVYGIVQQYGGQISVESQPGEGTTFRIYFPRANAAAPGPIAGAAGQAFRGTETILVAEDDELVRPLVCKILEDSGYRVMSARTGELACDLVRQANVPVALLVTDVAMPGMSGYDLAQKLKLAQAGVKVLFISGNDENAEALGGAFLKKPFTPDGLSSTVRTILGATE
jgi:PAS domain S-box-containing protein